MTNNFFYLDSFICENVTKRNKSLLAGDLFNNAQLLREEITNKKVLVIGGAGTIGSSFIKALLPYSPAKVIVVDINENGLTELVRDCRSTPGLKIPPDFRTYPINFGDGVFNKIFKSEAPFDIVANFAAHKHVRSEKDIYSIEAMIKNNVLLAKKLLDLLLEFPPKHFFCVSTDKAANPVNIMGASKKLMEDVILAYADKFPIKTARFANVAFSNGSLLAGFMDRFAKRQPLSCPNDVKRYFVSPQEAGEICLLSCILGKSGDIFFPKLDEERDMIPFSDIAFSLLEQLGFTPDICSSEEDGRQKALEYKPEVGKYPLFLFSSDTSGEKLFEEFYTSDETVDLDSFKNLGVIKNAPKKNKQELGALIITLEKLFERDIEKKDLVSLLQTVIPNFHHIETGLNLDQKM